MAGRWYVDPIDPRILYDQPDNIGRGAAIMVGVRGLLEKPVEGSSPVGHLLEQKVELLAVGRLAVGRAQGKRQEVQHGGDDESSGAAHLEEDLAKL